MVIQCFLDRRKVIDNQNNGYRLIRVEIILYSLPVFSNHNTITRKGIYF